MSGSYLYIVFMENFFFFGKLDKIFVNQRERERGF